MQGSHDEQFIHYVIVWQVLSSATTLSIVVLDVFIYAFHVSEFLFAHLPCKLVAFVVHFASNLHPYAFCMLGFGIVPAAVVSHCDSTPSLTDSSPSLIRSLTTVHHL